MHLLPCVRCPRRLLLACCLASIAIGCDATDDPPGDVGSLEGREFLLDSADGFMPVPDTSVRIHFDEERGEPSFGFHAGCNHHFGSYEIRDGRLVVQGFSSTQIGCSEPLSTQDSFLASFFTAEPAMDLDGDRLTFTGESATLEFLDREVADPDRPLTGRVWTIDSFITASSVGSLALSDPPTVRFEEDGSLQVFSGCNSAAGSFTQRGGELTLRDLAYTERGCTDALAGQAEAHVQSVLTDGTVQFEIEAARLTLMRGDLGLGATTE